MLRSWIASTIRPGGRTELTSDPLGVSEHMPSIEIACVGLEVPLEPPATSFAVVCEAGLRSHRSPEPRFRQDFDEMSGSLYHLGNPEFANTATGPFLAYGVLSQESREAEPPSFLEFAPEHIRSASEFMAWLLDASPEGKLLFTSDWQFGPEATRRFAALSLPEFWRLHDSRVLLLNSAYPIERSF
jgi:hypothetical protein